MSETQNVHGIEEIIGDWNISIAIGGIIALCKGRTNYICKCNGIQCRCIHTLPTSYTTVEKKIQPATQDYDTVSIAPAPVNQYVTSCCRLAVYRIAIWIRVPRVLPIDRQHMLNTLSSWCRLMLSCPYNQLFKIQNKVDLVPTIASVGKVCMIWTNVPYILHTVLHSKDQGLRV